MIPDLDHEASRDWPQPQRRIGRAPIVDVAHAHAYESQFDGAAVIARDRCRGKTFHICRERLRLRFARHRQIFSGEPPTLGVMTRNVSMPAGILNSARDVNILTSRVRPSRRVQ